MEYIKQFKTDEQGTMEEPTYVSKYDVATQIENGDKIAILRPMDSDYYKVLKADKSLIAGGGGGGIIRKTIGYLNLSRPYSAILPNTTGESTLNFKLSQIEELMPDKNPNLLQANLLVWASNSAGGAPCPVQLPFTIQKEDLSAIYTEVNAGIINFDTFSSTEINAPSLARVFIEITPQNQIVVKFTNYSDTKSLFVNRIQFDILAKQL